jgi:hypothetical protein
LKKKKKSDFIQNATSTVLGLYDRIETCLMLEGRPQDQDTSANDVGDEWQDARCPSIVKLYASDMLRIGKAASGAASAM